MHYLSEDEWKDLRALRDEMKDFTTRQRIAACLIAAHDHVSLESGIAAVKRGTDLDHAFRDQADEFMRNLQRCDVSFGR